LTIGNLGKIPLLKANLGNNALEKNAWHHEKSLLEPSFINPIKTGCLLWKSIDKSPQWA
jgi:hypothetical protein